MAVDAVLVLHVSPVRVKVQTLHTIVITSTFSKFNEENGLVDHSQLSVVIVRYKLSLFLLKSCI